MITYGFRRYTICTDVGFAQYDNKTECLTCHYDVCIEGYAPYCTTRRHRKGCPLGSAFKELVQKLKGLR